MKKMRSRPKFGFNTSSTYSFNLAAWGVASVWALTISEQWSVQARRTARQHRSCSRAPEDRLDEVAHAATHEPRLRDLRGRAGRAGVRRQLQHRRPVVLQCDTVLLIKRQYIVTRYCISAVAHGAGVSVASSNTAAQLSCSDAVCRLKN